MALGPNQMILLHQGSVVSRPGYPESSHHLQHGGSFAGARHAADVQHLAAAVGS